MKNRALVLVVVLWILVAVTAICLSMGVMARGRAREVLRQGSGGNDEAMLSSALNLACFILEGDDADADLFSDPWRGDGGNPARFTIRLDGRIAGVYAIEPDGTTRPGLADESARLNANTADASMLSRLPGMDALKAQRFVELRDRLEIAQAATPVAVNQAPVGVGGPISSEDQLAEMLEETLNAGGAAANASGGAGLPGGDFANPRGLGPDAARLLRLLSICSSVENLTGDGQARVNINTADVEQLTDLLGGQLTPEQISAIRISADASALTDAADLLRRDLLAPDFDGNMQPVSISAEDLATFYDAVTCSDSSRLAGRVNINTAPVEVLACLPGLNSALADTIAQFRASAAPETLVRATWPVSVLPLDVYVAVAPYITTRSSRFRCMVACRSADENEGLYAQAVIHRYMGRTTVIALERCRGIWHDP